MKDYLVIIPTYNEETTIKEVINGVQNNVPFCDIVVVDCNSKDNTQKIVKDLGIELIPHPFKLGYGESIYSGFKYAYNENYKNAITIDGDGQHNPVEIKELIIHFKKKDLDMIIGSRFLKNNNYRTSYIRHVGNKLFSHLTSLLLRKKITDTTSGFKIFNRKTIEFLLKHDYFSSDYFTADIIIFLALNNFRIDEIPVKMNERRHGESMFTPLQTFYYIYKTILSMFIIIMHSLIFKRIKK